MYSIPCFNIILITIGNDIKRSPKSNNNNFVINICSSWIRKSFLVIMFEIRLFDRREHRISWLAVRNTITIYLSYESSKSEEYNIIRFRDVSQTCRHTLIYYIERFYCAAPADTPAVYCIYLCTRVCVSVAWRFPNAPHVNCAGRYYYYYIFMFFFSFFRPQSRA